MAGARDKLVNAATDRFHALGYAACGVQEIVNTAGVPKGSFYNYFRGKELLAAEVVATYAAASRRELLSEAGIPPLDRIRRHFAYLVSHYAEGGYERGCLIGTLTSEASSRTPLLRDALERALGGWVEHIAKTIREGQAGGTIAVGLEPDRMARFIVNGWLGAVARMKLTACVQPLEDFLAVILPLLASHA